MTKVHILGYPLPDLLRLIEACGHTVQGSTTGPKLDALIDQLSKADHLPEGIDALVLSLSSTEQRQEALNRLDATWWCTLIDPTAIISPSSNIGTASVIMPGVIINAATIIEIGVWIGKNTIVEHDCHIGQGTIFHPMVTLCGGIRIGDMAELESHVVAIPQMTIGARAHIKERAVVVRPIDDNVYAGGCPARIL